MSSTRMSLEQVALAALAALFVACLLVSEASSAAPQPQKQTAEEFKRQIAPIEECLLRSAFSFSQPSTYPATTVDGFKKQCEVQTEGAKCVKEGIKNKGGIIKRGLGSVLAARQRFRRRFCTDVNSDDSKKFVAAMKCMMDNNLESMREGDRIYTQTANALIVNNYADPSVELKQFCCMVVRYRRGLLERGSRQCTDHKPMIEAFGAAIIGNELEMICEDEDKLMSKVCPSLPDPIKEADLKRASSKVNSTMTPGAASLYLVSTLGEQE